MKNFTNICAAVFASLLIFSVSVVSVHAEDNVSESGAYQFSRTLAVGSKGPDVYLLQRYLNTNGFMLATSGPGSLGHETNLYGGLTRKAVAKFQKVYQAKIAGLNVPTGTFAYGTRDFVNSAFEKNVTSGAVLGAFTSNK